MTRSLQEQLDRHREQSAAKRPPELNAAIARAIEDLRASGLADTAPSVGDRAPDFALPNVHGKEIRLGDLIGRGPVVLAFYRGAW